MKKLTLLACLAVGGLMGAPAYADVVGSCWPTSTVSGQAHKFDIIENLTADDVPGTTQSTWNNKGNFNGICLCQDSSVPESILFRFTSTKLGTGGGKRNADFIYYPLDAEKGINIGINVVLGGEDELRYIPVDLSNTAGVDNGRPATNNCDDKNDHTLFATGSSGTVSLELTKPLPSGRIDIPMQELVTIFAKKQTGSYDTSRPFVTLNFQLSIDIPPQCMINDGQTIKVPFGNITANEFKPEATGKQKSVDIRVTCKNPEDESKVSIKFRASDFNGSGFIKTHNDEGERNDLGIKLEHNGNKIDGSSSAVPTQEGNVTIIATPVQQGEKSPQPGKFEATSTLDFEFK